MAQQSSGINFEHQGALRGTKRLLAGLAVASLLATAAALAFPASTVRADAATSNQAVTATVIAGVLTVTAPPALVTNLTPGTNNTGIALALLAYTNTLNDSLAWSVTCSSTSWINGAKTIPFTNMTVTVGTTITGLIGSVGTPTAGAGGALTGTDTTPGTTQSTAVTLANGTSTTQGAYTQTGTTIAVLVPGNTTTGVYTGTIQYTITG
jgi:hypothetical protein